MARWKKLRNSQFQRWTWKKVIEKGSCHWRVKFLGWLLIFSTFSPPAAVFSQVCLHRKQRFKLVWAEQKVKLCCGQNLSRSHEIFFYFLTWLTFKKCKLIYGLYCIVWKRNEQTGCINVKRVVRSNVNLYYYDYACKNVPVPVQPVFFVNTNVSQWRLEWACELTVTIKPTLKPTDFEGVCKIHLNFPGSTYPDLSFARFFSSLAGRTPEHLWRSSQQTTPEREKSIEVPPF